MQPEQVSIHFELKYCERCGGLWLRRRDSAAVYCSLCARRMADVDRRRLQPQAAVSTLAPATAGLLLCLLPWLEITWGGLP